MADCPDCSKPPGHDDCHRCQDDVDARCRRIASEAGIDATKIGLSVEEIVAAISTLSGQQMTAQQVSAAMAVMMGPRTAATLWAQDREHVQRVAATGFRAGWMRAGGDYALAEDEARRFVAAMTARVDERLGGST